MATTDMDLRTGRTVWQARRAARVTPLRLARDIETDVLVIGAGITGAVIAHALTEEGCKVVIVDRRGAALGSTAASTALVQYDIDTPLTILTRKIGKDHAQRAWRRSRLAVESLAALLQRVAGAAAARRNTLYLAGNVLDRGALRREGEVRRAAGLETTFIERRDLHDRFGIHGGGALLSYGNLAIDPRKTTLALLADAIGKGARLYAPVDIADIDGGRTVTARTAEGLRIRARRLVLATGYEFPDAVPRRSHQIISTWAIATAPQRGRLWPTEAFVWEAADPYLYVRTTPEGRVICGGEDEEFSDAHRRDVLIARKTKTLQRKLARCIPGIDTGVDFAWAGSFGQSATGLPRIGEVPGMANCWAALGYGGNGITYARIAAEIIRGAFAGRPDSDADLYAFPVS